MSISYVLEPKQRSCGTSIHDKLSNQWTGTDKSRFCRQAGCACQPPSLTARPPWVGALSAHPIEAEATESIWLFNSSLGKGPQPNPRASVRFTGDAGAGSPRLQNGQSQGRGRGQTRTFCSLGQQPHMTAFTQPLPLATWGGAG